MRILVLTLVLSLLVTSAHATSDAYAKKAAEATAAAAAAAAKTAPLAPGPEDGKTETVATPEVPLASTKPSAKKSEGSEQAAKPASLSAEDKADVERIEAYLNSLKSISADFLQVDDQGGMTRGTIEIQRPGKMRVTYAPPSHDFIVADGGWVHIWDGSLKSQTNVPQDDSLANFILHDPIKLSGDITVTKFQRYPAKLELTLAQTKDSGSGQLTLIFEDKPLLLRQWKVVDAQGRLTGVNLENERTGVKFANDTFTFVPPNFGKGGKAQ